MLAALQENRQKLGSLKHRAPSGFKAEVMATIHTQLEDELSAYVDGELAPATQERIDTHLQSCSACTDTVAAFRANSERIKAASHPVPAEFETAVMTKIRQQASVSQEETRQGSRISRWLPDVGRWFFRPVTACATGVMTLVLILGALYFYPTGSDYEETLDFYFELHTEQLTGNGLDLSIDISSTNTPASEEAFPTETADDAELFLDLYMEDVGY